MAEEAVIQRRHIASHNQCHDARVIELVPPLGDLLAVIRQGVIRSAHAQTHDGTPKEARKDEHVGRIGGLIARANNDVDVQGRENGDDGAGEVRPDVDGLVVQVEERAGGLGVGGADGAVAGADEGVVAAPGGEVVPEEEELLLDFAFGLLDGREEGFGDGGPALAEGRVGGHCGAFFFCFLLARPWCFLIYNGYYMIWMEEI